MAVQLIMTAKKSASASRIQMYCKTEWQSDYIDSLIESPMTARSLRAHN